MASRAVVSIFLLSALPLLCLELRRGIPSFGIKELILLSGRMLLLLTLLTIVISVATSWINSLKSSQVHSKEGGEEDENRQQLVREKQQEAQGEQASRYIQNVLKPQQEMKLKRLEERFYQMTGETWKLTTGHKLEGDKDLVLENSSQASSETANREAARRRNWPKLLTNVSPPPQQPAKKKVSDLPEEPSETAEEVVTVALRCPSGRVLRRRFFKSWNSQVLLDWMMKIGYPEPLYNLSTSFPRRSLKVEGGVSLEDIGITVDTVLNVEEKEQSSQ
ncbi:UBX domain-containing protein 8 isoform X1 [Sigmodon hispidus]